MLGVVAIVISLALLMAIAYRGFPVVVFAPVCAGVALALSGVPILPGYTGPFMTGAAVLLVYWLILFWMYRRKLFLRV